MLWSDLDLEGVTGTRLGPVRESQVSKSDRN